MMSDKSQTSPWPCAAVSRGDLINDLRKVLEECLGMIDDIGEQDIAEWTGFARYYGIGHRIEDILSRTEHLPLGRHLMEMGRGEG